MYKFTLILATVCALVSPPPTTARYMICPAAQNITEFEIPQSFPDARKTYDPLESFAKFMGFEKKEKWKSVRYSAYALLGGYLISEKSQAFLEMLKDPFWNV